MYTHAHPLVRRLATAALALGLAAPTGAHALCLDPPGDLTGNGVTNIADAMCGIVTVNWLQAGSVGAEPGCLGYGGVSRADIRCDGSVTVGNVQLLISLALGLSMPTAIDSDGSGCADECEQGCQDCFEPTVGSGCTKNSDCWTNFCQAGVCTNPVEKDCAFSPPSIPADGETASTLTCTVTGSIAQNYSLWVDLSAFGGSSQTYLTEVEPDVWQLANITVPEGLTPGLYTAEIQSETIANKGFAELTVVVPALVDDDTYIYFYFDSSGSMNSTLAPLQALAGSGGPLEAALLKFYGNDPALYNQRVSVSSWSNERFFQKLPEPNNDKVLIFIFQDEAANAYHTSAGYGCSPTSGFQSDFNAWKNKISNPASYSLYRAAMVAVTGGTTQQTFNNFVQDLWEGTGPFGQASCLQYNLTAYNPALNGGVPPAGQSNALMTYVRDVTDGVTYSSNPLYYFDIIQDLAEEFQVFIPDPGPPWTP